MLRDFYRMEGKDGQGPYRGQHYDWPWDEFDVDQHPLPGITDGIDYWSIEGDHVFGFESLEKALEWFTPIWLTGLTTHERAVPQEFRITHYLAQEWGMLFGIRQTLAKLSTLVYVETIELKDLLDKNKEDTP